MKNKFVDHLFSKIVEGRYEKALSSLAAQSKLEQLEEIGEKIRQSEGEEVCQNVLGYREVKRALEQCLDHIENSSSSVTDTDFYIYLSFASERLKEAESIIDEELTDYDL